MILEIILGIVVYVIFIFALMLRKENIDMYIKSRDMGRQIQTLMVGSLSQEQNIKRLSNSLRDRNELVSDLTAERNNADLAVNIQKNKVDEHKALILLVDKQLKPIKYNSKVYKEVKKAVSDFIKKGSYKFNNKK